MLAAKNSPAKETIESFFADSTWTELTTEEFDQLELHEKLKRIRHSGAHVLAQAILSLHDDAQLATGPATREGFFYDVKIDKTFRPEDLKDIQKAYNKICKQRQKFSYTTASKSKTRELFETLNLPMKLHVLDKIPGDEVTFFKNGPFYDLCAGPHVPNSELCKHTKIVDATSAHWLDEERPSLSRVKGICWDTAEGLQNYIKLTQEIKNRDHRTLGPSVGLFHFHEYGASAFWEPKGVILRKRLMQFWDDYLNKNQYVEILNPLLYKKELFQCSGHWDHFQENMFIFKDEEGNPDFVLKPMNCPDTMLFFKSKSRSYRELPYRVAEGQVLHRNEAHGALHGIMRTRNFVQDDAHIFLSSEQVEQEIRTLLDNLKEIYKLFDLEFSVALSTRPDSYMGELEVWNQAEQGLKDALNNAGQAFRIDPGEGAFYGPKIDITVHDSLGRDWQCGTIQLDFQLPERFDLTYTDSDGSEKRPIVVHRAIFGSFERFIGILIEHFGAAFPTWLAPTQLAILPISEAFDDYAKEVQQAFQAKGVRVALEQDGSLNARIRSCFNRNKIPNIVIVGEQETKDRTLTIRKIKETEQRTIPLEEYLEELATRIQAHSLDVQVDNPGKFLRAYDDTSTEDAEY